MKKEDRGTLRFYWVEKEDHNLIEVLQFRTCVWFTAISIHKRSHAEV